MVTAQPIAKILGLGAEVRSMQELDIAVNAGLPKRSLVLLSSRLYCDDRAASAFKFQVIPPATWKRRTKRLSRQESERIERLARTLADAEHVFDDRDDARQWMSAPHKELNGKTPIETARTEIGADCNQFRHPLQSYAATAATLCPHSCKVMPPPASSR